MDKEHVNLERDILLKENFVMDCFMERVNSPGLMVLSTKVNSETMKSLVLVDTTGQIAVTMKARFLTV
jgi:hypothetical protein